MLEAFFFIIFSTALQIKHYSQPAFYYNSKFTDDLITTRNFKRFKF